MGRDAGAPQTAVGVTIELDGASASGTTWVLVVCGTLGGVLFTAVYIVEGALRHGYNAAANPISVLSLGPGGVLQRANFVVFGILVLASSVGWRRLLEPGIGAWAYPTMRVVAGLGLIVDGFLSQDPIPGYPPGTRTVTATLHGNVHSIAATAVILGLAVGDFVLARRFTVEPRWRPWSPFAVATGVVTVVFISLFGAMGANGGIAGVCERLAGGANSVLGVALVTKLALQRRTARRSVIKAHSHFNVHGVAHS